MQKINKCTAILIIIAFSILSFISCDTADDTAHPVFEDTVLGNVERDTQNGTVIGEHYSHKGFESYRFRGIPYAKAPVGDLRFRPPADPDDYENGEMEAFDYSQVCMQSSFNDGTANGSEDCLYLNVWTPTDADSATKKPVMLFMHGGGNSFGGANETLSTVVLVLAFPAIEEAWANLLSMFDIGFFKKDAYDGHYLAGRSDVILVNINFRLGPFGHMAHPSLGEGSGNFSFLDMKKALEWVQANIGQFGGDKDNVTIFGQSAGAWNVCGLMNMPSAEGLFHKGIMQSQSCQSRTKEQAETWGNYHTKAAGCDDAADVAACLRDVDGIEFFKLTLGNEVQDGFTPYVPMIDGDIFPEWFGDAMKGGSFHHVPLIVGTNDNEAFLYTLSDGFVNCSVDTQLKIFGDDLQAPVYQYRFEHSPLTTLIPAIHLFELPYVFGTARDMFGDSSREVDVANAIGDYWTNFARTGNPNASDLLDWPQYNNDSRQFIRLNKENTIGSGSIVKSQVNCLASEFISEAFTGDIIKFW